GVGITPPNVVVTPKPVSSVIIKRMFGAPFGGTTRAGHQGVDCAALRSILPSNFCGGGGSWLPGIVVVALGEPGAPVVSCALAAEVSAVAARRAASRRAGLFSWEFLHLLRGRRSGHSHGYKAKGEDRRQSRFV